MLLKKRGIKESFRFDVGIKRGSGSFVTAVTWHHAVFFDRGNGPLCNFITDLERRRRLWRNFNESFPNRSLHANAGQPDLVAQPDGSLGSIRSATNGTISGIIGLHRQCLIRAHPRVGSLLLTGTSHLNLSVALRLRSSTPGSISGYKQDSDHLIRR